MVTVSLFSRDNYAHHIASVPWFADDVALGLLAALASVLTRDNNSQPSCSCHCGIATHRGNDNCRNQNGCSDAYLYDNHQNQSHLWN